MNRHPDKPPPSKRRTGWGREKVRAALGLTVWEIELSVRTGLLQRLLDRRFDDESVRAALADTETFRTRLAAEHRLNATEAARRLGVSRERFTRVVADTGLAPVAEEQIRKYGRDIAVRYYRAADVDSLPPRVGADIALRGAATAFGRSAAARKAAQTRARNRARAERARLELYAAEPAPDDPATRVLAYTAGLVADQASVPGFLSDFTDVPEARRITALVRDCRLSPAEHTAMARGFRERAQAAYEALASPDEVHRRLGVCPGSLCGRTEMLMGHVPRGTVRAWEDDPPEWLLLERAALAAAEAGEAALRAREKEEQRVLREAEQQLKCTDETVAELFGLPVDVVAGLRRSRGKPWRWVHVEQLRGRPPTWLRSEEAAREEVRRRRESRTRNRKRRTRRWESWRQTWARELDVPLERVPEKVPKPTPKTIRSLKRHRPHWSRPHQG
ncbi:hypothetical protein [Nocardiopsis sp. HUAS JQ3]|uniref:hypothetical protein n=1 Tax=Nocardiopsis sp. HUAS JQ3 TaxID=3061629 RepID=UPI0023A9AC60|nr:hypothetical protein [Nocardiopsis sp. HUAS JQ3]WDZ88536.1 hypothetical protein PV789_16325 [Nocardiopsis sp. HUAS JQ3]